MLIFSILFFIAWLLIYLIFKFEVELVKIHTMWYIRYKVTKYSSGEMYKITKLFKLV